MESSRILYLQYSMAPRTAPCTDRQHILFCVSASTAVSRIKGTGVSRFLPNASSLAGSLSDSCVGVFLQRWETLTVISSHWVVKWIFTEKYPPLSCQWRIERFFIAVSLTKKSIWACVCPWLSWGAQNTDWLLIQGTHAQVGSKIWSFPWLAKGQELVTWLFKICRSTTEIVV